MEIKKTTDGYLVIQSVSMYKLYTMTYRIPCFKYVCMCVGVTSVRAVTDVCGLWWIFYNTDDGWRDYCLRHWRSAALRESIHVCVCIYAFSNSYNNTETIHSLTCSHHPPRLSTSTSFLSWILLISSVPPSPLPPAPTPCVLHHFHCLRHRDTTTLHKRPHFSQPWNAVFAAVINES